jgi:hypothetical protein
LSRSGGFAGLRLEGELDTEALDRPLAAQVQERLRAERLREIAAAGPSRAVDSMQYEITLDVGRAERRFSIDEAAAPGEIVETLQALVREIVRRKRKG